MEPFNTRTRHGNKEVSLAILSGDNEGFKIMDYGGTLGRIKKNNKEQ